MTEFFEYLRSGATHLCRAWSVERLDGEKFGFTDHDRDLEFAGTTFDAGAGLNPMAMQQTTGLSVDNTETLGALRADKIREADIAEGLYDGAEVIGYVVCWDQTDIRQVTFRGTIGTISRQGSQFSAELRGLTDGLNTNQGQVFQRYYPRTVGGAQSTQGLYFPHLPGEDWLMSVPRADKTQTGGSLQGAGRLMTGIIEGLDP